MFNQVISNNKNNQLIKSSNDMKKYLMSSVAAIAFVAALTSCTSHDFEPMTPAQIQEAKYEQVFIQRFGQPAANQDWGFNTIGVSTRTRAITVNGDVYEKFPSQSDIASAFPTTIPENADEVSELETLYKGKTIQGQYGPTTLYDLYAIYSNIIVEGYNLKITQAGEFELGGSYQNAGWDASAGANVARPYNVYVNVDGNVTIKRNGATHFNLYILKGNVTLNSDYGEQAGLISVAAGATLNDGRSSIAANQGIKMYNRGTINATNPTMYDIGNFCTVYNEGKFNVTGALTYSPGDANTSYFMNFSDDAELTAPSMTLNSAGNFYNDGKVTITGETNVTQKDIYWVNNGHYTTGSMTFSAKNATFYNYCQLIIKGNAHMYDGEFNLMENSYTEAGTAEFDNFIVNMGSNTGMNIKGTVKFEAQGDGTYQGFRTSGTGSYVLIGGKVTVASHKKTFSISSGITYSINSIEIIKNGAVTTEEILQKMGDGDYPVLDLNGTECPYGKLTVTPNATGCGATWKIDGGGIGGSVEPTPNVRIIAEDLTVDESGDFDFNDVVFDVIYNYTYENGEYKENNGTSVIILRAAGGTLPLYVDGHEVHQAFGVGVKTMVNTKAGVDGKTADPFVVNYNAAINIPITVTKKDANGEEYTVTLTAEAGRVPHKIAVKPTFQWCNERDDIEKIYPLFGKWVVDPSESWY